MVPDQLEARPIPVEGVADNDDEKILILLLNHPGVGFA